MEPEKKPSTTPPVNDEGGFTITDNSGTPADQVAVGQTPADTSFGSDSSVSAPSDPLSSPVLPDQGVASDPSAPVVGGDSTVSIAPEDPSAPLSDASSVSSDSLTPDPSAPAPSDPLADLQTPAPAPDVTTPTPVVDAPPADPTDPSVVPPAPAPGLGDTQSPATSSDSDPAVAPAPVVTGADQAAPAHSPFAVAGGKNKTMVMVLVGAVVVVVAAVLIYAVVSMM